MSLIGDALKKVNWGNVVSKGFDWVTTQIGKNKTAGPLGASNPPAAANQSLPSWVLPVAIVAGLFLLIKKRKK